MLSFRPTSQQQKSELTRPGLSETEDFLQRLTDEACFHHRNFSRSPEKVPVVGFHHEGMIVGKLSSETFCLTTVLFSCPSQRDLQLFPSLHSDSHHIRRIAVSSFLSLPSESPSDTTKRGFFHLEDPEVPPTKQTHSYK